MAKPKPAPEAAAAAAPAKRSRKKLIVIAAAFVSMTAAGAAGAYYYLKAKDAAATPAVAAHKPPVFLPLDPFTVNLLRENGDHFLQVGLVYQVDDEKTVETLKTYLPVIRSRILLLLSSKHPSDLSNLEGKEKLVSELLETARASLPDTKTPERGVDSAYIASFVIQ